MSVQIKNRHRSKTFEVMGSNDICLYFSTSDFESFLWDGLTIDFFQQFGKFPVRLILKNI